MEIEWMSQPVINENVAAITKLYAHSRLPGNVIPHTYRALLVSMRQNMGIISHLPRSIIWQYGAAAAIHEATANLRVSKAVRICELQIMDGKQFNTAIAMLTRTDHDGMRRCGTARSSPTAPEIDNWKWFNRVPFTMV